MKTVHKGLLAMLFVIIESALLTIALQVGGASIGAVPLLLYSSLVGSLTMLVVTVVQDRGRELILIAKDKKTFVIFFVTGIFSIGISQVTLTWGTMGTTPSISSIMWRTYPLMIAIMTPLALRQKVGGMQFLALLLGFVSVGVVLSNGGLTSINYTELPYIILTLVSAFMIAATTIVVKGYNAGTVGITTIANLASFIFILPVVLIWHINIPVNISSPTILSIILVGMIANGVGTVLFFHVYKIFDISTAGLGMMTIPFLTVVLSFVFLGTTMQWYYFLAAILLTIGMFVQIRGSLKAPERIKTNSGLEQMRILDITQVFSDNHKEGIYRYLRANGRALAIKLDDRKYEETRHENIFRKRNCIAFTNINPHKDAGMDEIKLIDKITGLSKGETLLIAIGEPKKIESAFEEFDSMTRSG